MALFLFIFSTVVSFAQVKGKVVGVSEEDRLKLRGPKNETLKTNNDTDCLKAGLAWHYEKYDHNPAWAKLEIDAKSARKGLWFDATAVAPWEWKK